MDDRAFAGSCLCGEVRYEIVEPLGRFQYCHCSRCRKFTGSAHAANVFVPPAQFRWTAGEDSVGRYEHPGAEHFATGFCKRCGSSLPWLTQSGITVVVPAGTLDEAPGVQPSRNIFWDSRAPWFEDSSALEKIPGTPQKR